METSILQRVKKVRNENKVSQIEFANTLGVSASYIAGLEMGRNSLNQKFLQAIKEKYNVSIDWLMFGKESTSNTPDIDILKIVVALDNSNRFLIFALKETIIRLEESNNPDDKKALENFQSDEFKSVFELILNLDSQKRKLYTSILEDVVIGDKSNFELTQKIKQYSEINLELNKISNEYFSGLESLELIDSDTIITQLSKKK
ncbi:MAG: helix-turn-helix transcriptional regulator [Marinifilaceae bacterium]|jgi:transcriptional regulator with XRE-family HTH domain|nr:helix-turn-helix transcriptional regulator [Marinifilaceae bacterium]